MNVLEGKLTAKGMKVAIVVARFNEFITSKLMGGAFGYFVPETNGRLFYLFANAASAGMV